MPRKKRTRGFLVDEVAYGIFRRTPIYIVEVIEGALFPVRFEYRERGYKGLVFSERLSNIAFE